MLLFAVVVAPLVLSRFFDMGSELKNPRTCSRTTSCKATRRRSPDGFVVCPGRYEVTSALATDLLRMMVKKRVVCATDLPSLAS